MENNTEIVLPAIAVRGVVPLPNNEFKVEVGRQNSVLALDASEKMYGGNIILLVQKESSVKDVKEDDIEKIGVLAKVTLKLRLPSNNYRVKFKVIDRIEVKEFKSVDPYFVITYDKIFSILSNDDLEKALVNNVAASVSKNAQNLLTSPDEVAKLLQSGTNAGVLSDVIAFQLKLSSNLSKYRYLEELSVSKRLELILGDIEYEKHIVEIENKINNDVKK